MWGGDRIKGRQRKCVLGALGQMNLMEQDVSSAQYKKHCSDLDVCRLDYV